VRVAVRVVLRRLADVDARRAQLVQRVRERVDEKPIERDVSPRARGPAIANREPSGSANMSASTPAVVTGWRPRTSVAKRVISGLLSVALPAKTSPRIRIASTYLS